MLYGCDAIRLRVMSTGSALSNRASKGCVESLFSDGSLGYSRYELDHIL
jgi:hypothetical protein